MILTKKISKNNKLIYFIFFVKCSKINYIIENAFLLSKLYYT